MNAVPRARPPEVSDAAVRMIQQWLELSEVERRAFLALSRELTASSELVETSTLDLSERFQALASTAQGQVAQVETIIALSKSIEVNGKIMPLDEAMRFVEGVLIKVIDAILSVSKHAMRMVYALEEIERDVEGSEVCVVEIEAINSKTRYLALNAAIEASHAGGTGGPFGVIAREMKELSQEIANASRQVSQRISAVRRGVREGHSVLREIATLDLSEHILAKQNIDSLLEGIIVQNAAFSAALADTAQSSGDLTQTIGQLITGMQFQDRTKQHLGQVIDVLGVLQANSQLLEQATRDALPGLPEAGDVGHDWIERIVEKQTLGSVKSRILMQLLSDGGADSAAGLEAGSESASVGSDIELF